MTEKVKLFWSYDMDDEDGDVDDIQKRINSWFKKNSNIEVVDRIHTFHDKELLIAIYYKEIPEIGL